MNNYPFFNNSHPRAEGAFEIEIRVRAQEKKMALLNAEYKDEEAGRPKQTNKPSQGMFAGLMALLKAPRRQLASITHK